MVRVRPKRVRMLAVHLVVLVSGVLFCARDCRAGFLFFDKFNDWKSAVDDYELVKFNIPRAKNGPANNVRGIGQNSDFFLSFFSDDVLEGSDGGQAKVVVVDGGANSVNVGPGFRLHYLEALFFNVSRTKNGKKKDETTDLTFTVTDETGYSQIFEVLDVGISTPFGVVATGGHLIATATVTASGYDLVAEIDQPRVTGSIVFPEPSTFLLACPWLLGFKLRRRATRKG